MPVRLVLSRYMGTTPNPATGTPSTAPVLQGAAIALRAQGKSKRKIAEELGIHRNTVSKILEAYQTDTISCTESIQKKLVPKALARIEQVLENDTDTAKYVLDNTLFRRESSQYQVSGDMHVSQAVNLLPSTPSSASTAMTTGTAGTTESTGTEAAAKPPGSDMSLSLHPNFSNFSDEQLEQELARRRSARVVDAEVLG